MISIPVEPPRAPLRRGRLEQYAVVFGFSLVTFNVLLVGLAVSSSAVGTVPVWNTLALPRTIGETFKQSAALNETLQSCGTAECQHRLHELQTKLILEEKIYRAMYQTELNRTKQFSNRTYDQKEIINEIRDQAERNEGEERYIPKPEWINKSHPEICIIGFPKTGSSQLYNLFATHRDVHKIENDYKEHCAINHISADGPKSTHEYGLYSWHQHYYQEYDGKHPRVNGCFDLVQAERQFVYSPPSPQAKFFIILRDPAEWLWATYNFWLDDAWEDLEPKNGVFWVDEGLHYRSPEAFHEVVLSGGKLRASNRWAGFRFYSVWSTRRILALVGKDNLIFLKNEDMQPDHVQLPGGVLDRLSEATKLAKDGFDETILHSRSNCNSNKGIDALCTDERHHNSVGYPVTHNRPMLEATRRFIYVQWHAECKVWAEEFGIVYPDCLAAIDDSA